jgi:single-strand DNA-binding protein
MSFRQITLLGNVGKDPLIKTLPSGATVASFSIAVSESYFDKKSNEKKETTNWFNCSVWQSGDTGLVTSVVKPYVTKGTMLFVTGLPEIQEYEKDNVKQRAFNVRLGGPGSTLRLCGGKGNGGQKPAAVEVMPAADDDSIPF